MQNIRGIFDDAELIVAGGLEPVAPFALLRSVVVRRDYRAQGLAKRMTVHLLRIAQTQGVTSVYLLTETAEAYFEAIGFRRVEREEVPEAVQRTRQFDSLCPQTASCMRLDLPFTAVVSS